LKSTAQEIVIQTLHGAIAAKRWAHSDGIRTIGLHGWLDNANTFDCLAPLLPMLDLVSMDLPGHGRSHHRPAGMRYHYTDYVDDVIALADALEWERFVLLGHSMGAGIACLTASAFADRVSCLMLIEGMGAVTDAADDVAAALRRAVLARQTDARRTPPVYRDMQVLVRARAAAGAISRASAKRLVQRAVIEGKNGLQWQSDQRLKQPFPQYFNNAMVLSFLSAITAPVLLIVGRDGMLAKRPYYESRCSVIQDLSRIELPGHHHLHMDFAEPVAQAIDHFLQHRMQTNP